VRENSVFRAVPCSANSQSYSTPTHFAVQTQCMRNIRAASFRLPAPPNSLTTQALYLQTHTP
jgi:hypothetical protein